MTITRLLAVALITIAGCSIEPAARPDAGRGRDAGTEIDWPEADGGGADAGIEEEPPHEEPDAAIVERDDARPPADVDLETPEDRARFVRFRVGTVNAPESAKPGLIMPRELRARRMVNWFAENDITLSALQEAGTYIRREAAERPAWGSTWAVPNNVIAGREVGNGIIFRSGHIAVLDEANIRVRMAGRPNGLNVAVRLLEHRQDTDRRARFVMFAFHAPTRRDDPDDSVRAAMRREIRMFANRCIAAGLPVIVAGDSNDGGYGSHFPDMRAAAHHSVDWILVSRGIRIHGEGVRSIPDLSDHDAVWASISVPIDASAPRRLPAL